jgi:3-isopropylmalate/(R)-2-methylmalate dehydratase large subunit
MNASPRTLFEKIWDAHVVREEPGRPALLYIDLHLVHEVTSPQAFDGLRLAGRKVRRPERTVATMDHNVPTTDRRLPIADDSSRLQMETLARNCREFGITLYDIHSPKQGIVHVIGPELGLTQPGHDDCLRRLAHQHARAFGALAFGIGPARSSTFWRPSACPRSPQDDGDSRQRPPRPGVTAKDIILAIIGKNRHRRRDRRYVVEYNGRGPSGTFPWRAG